MLLTHFVQVNVKGKLDDLKTLANTSTRLSDSTRYIVTTCGTFERLTFSEETALKGVLK